MTDDEWRSRFLQRLADSGHPHLKVFELLALSEVSELRKALGDDPVTAADRELLGWSTQPGIQ